MCPEEGAGVGVSRGCRVRLSCEGVCATAADMLMSSYRKRRAGDRAAQREEEDQEPAEAGLFVD